MPIVSRGALEHVVDVFVAAEANPSRRPRRVRKLLRNATLEQAKRLEAEIRAQIEETGASAKDIKSLKLLQDALDLAWNDVEEGWKNQRDGVQSLRRARVACQIVGLTTPVRVVDRKAFVAIREELEGKELAPSTVRAHQLAFHRVLYFAEREGWVSALPKWKCPQIRNGRTFTFSEEQEREIVAYFQAIQQQDMADLFVLGIETGCRLGELLSIEGRRVTIEQCLMLLPGSLTKNGEARQVVLTRKAQSILARRVEAWGVGLLFPGWTNRMVSTLMARLREHMGEEDNKEFVFHATRHTCGRRMAAKGVSLFAMMEQLGHKSGEMTQRYVHLSAFDRKREIAAKMTYSEGVEGNT